MFFVGAYDLYKGASLYKDYKKIIRASIIWVSIIVFYFFWTRTFFFSRFILLGSVFSTTLGFLFIRYFFDIYRKKYLSKEKVFIIGEGEYLKKIIQAFQKTNIYEIESGEIWKEDENYDLLVISQNINSTTTREYIEYCLIHHIRVFVYTPNFLSRHNEIEVSHLKMREIFDTPLYDWKRVQKRIFDIIFSIVAIVLTLPITIIVSVLIKLTSKGPIVVQLQRIKRGNTSFNIYKFRSMVNNAHALKDSLLSHNERSDGPLFKMKNDPRITPLGRFLRKSRIDEIPQFINVLKGEMSVVGPRPHEPKEVALYTKKQKRLLMIKPGITGMAQISGASDLSFQEEYEIDMDYIQNWSMWKDIVIIIKTILVVINKKGAA